MTDLSNFARGWTMHRTAPEGTSLQAVQAGSGGGPRPKKRAMRMRRYFRGFRA